MHVEDDWDKHIIGAGVCKWMCVYQFRIMYEFLYLTQGNNFRVSEDLDDEAEEFSYDVQDRGTRKTKSVEYVSDETGNRLKHIRESLLFDI